MTDEESKAYHRAYYLANREKVKARVRAYALANPDKVKAKRQAYQAANSERLAAKSKAYYEAHRAEVIAQAKTYAKKHWDELSAYKKRWVAENKEHVRAQRKAFREANKERLAAVQRAQYRANPDAYKARARKSYERIDPATRRSQWHARVKKNYAQYARTKRAWERKHRAEHPEYYREVQARRTAKKRGARIERINYKRILLQSNGLCGICKKPLDLFGTDFDHIVPLALGGTHTNDNIQVAHARCNRAKGARVVA